MECRVRYSPISSSHRRLLRQVFPSEPPWLHSSRNPLGPLRTLLQSRTCGPAQTTPKNTLFHFLKMFLSFSAPTRRSIYLLVIRQEIDELVDEWTSELLGVPHSRRTDRSRINASMPVVSGANGPRPKLVNTGKQVLTLASYNLTGLAGNETIKMRAIETLRKYGIGSCGPPGTVGASICSQSVNRDE